MSITGRTRVIAVLGDPVAHSLSPLMHNAAFRVLGLDAVYVPLRCSPERLPQVMRSLVEAGGAGNVTVPHKLGAASAVDRMLGPLPDTCNTFWGEDGVLVGDNTDVAGILHGLDYLEAVGTRWLVVGAGGSCRAAVAAAAARGATVILRARSSDRADRVIVWARTLGVEVTSGADDECDVVINTTPLGLRADDPLPVTPFETPRARWVLDLVYGKGETPFVRAYRERGVAASDGRHVLVSQGTAAFARWFPSVEPATEVMRAAVRAALG